MHLPDSLPAAARALILTFGLASLCPAMDSDDILGVGQLPSCASIEFHGTRKMVEFEAMGQRDSSLQVLGLIENYCGPDEVVFRFKALMAAERGVDYIDSVPAPLAQRYLSWYQDRAKAQRLGIRFENVGNFYHYWGHPSFDTLTRAMTARLDSRRYPELSMVYADRFSEYHEFLLAEEGVRPQQRMVQEILTDMDEGPSLYLALALGSWIPLGSLRGTNPHPTFGFDFGGGAGRWNLGLDFYLLFPNGPYDYQVVFRDTLRTASNFSGPITSLKLSLELLRTVDWNISAVGSAGWAFLYAYVEDCTTPGCVAKDASVDGPAWSAGVRLTRWFNGFGQVFLLPRYQYLALDNPGGTPLRGGSLSVQLGVGVEAGPTRQRALKYLRGK